MTVKKLIRELSELPQDMLVYTKGYEGSSDDVDEIEIIKVIRNKNKSCNWLGDHKIIEKYELSHYNDYQIETGILI